MFLWGPIMPLVPRLPDDYTPHRHQPSLAHHATPPLPHTPRKPLSLSSHTTITLPTCFAHSRPFIPPSPNKPYLLFLHTLMYILIRTQRHLSFPRTPPTLNRLALYVSLSHHSLSLSQLCVWHERVMLCVDFHRMCPGTNDTTGELSLLPGTRVCLVPYSTTQKHSYILSINFSLPIHSTAQKLPYRIRPLSLSPYLS